MADKKKILIIEDEKNLADMYKLRFEQGDYQVLAAYNGFPGVEMAIKEKPDLVLLDIIMPYKDGYQVIQDLKREPQTKDIPIIIFSNLGQKEEIEKGLKLGAVDYLVKTDLTPSEALEKVRAFFEKHS